MNDTTTRAASPFWNFSLRLYGRPGVPPACLALQDSAGLDVNVLLFCLFAAWSGRALAPADAARLLETTGPWKDGAVVNLRRARVYLREPAPFIDVAEAAALRQRVKALELEAERLQQEGLYAAFPATALGAPSRSAESAARDNAAALQRAMGVTFDQGALGVILAAFDSLGDRQS